VNAPVNHQAVAPVIDFELRVDQYVRLRNKVKGIKEKHKEELAPYNDAMDKLEALLLQGLNSTGQESAKASSGTVYKTTRRSASLEDPEVFLDFVRTSGHWELLDRKANAPAVSDYMEQNGVVVPGVKFTTMIEVGVRAPSKK
jgi:hypothetical protein